MKTRLIISVVFLLASISLHAQGYYWKNAGKKKYIQNLTVDAGLGLRMYSGDIQQRGSLFNPMKFAYGLGVRYQVNERFGFTLNGAGRGYKGIAEQGEGFPDAMEEMNGKLWEGNVTVQFSILKWTDFTKRQFADRDPITKGNVFIGVGGGAGLFNGSYSSLRYATAKALDVLGNDSNYTYLVSTSGSGSGFGFYVPIVFGARYRFDPMWSLGLEMNYHMYFSDNLDGLERGQKDAISLFMLKLGYTFGQNKKKANIGKTPNQKRKGK